MKWAGPKFFVHSFVIEISKRHPIVFEILLQKHHENKIDTSTKFY